MALTSVKYYFVAHTKFGGTDIPILALHHSDEYQRGWGSNGLTSVQGMKQFVDWVSASRLLSIAVPRFFLPYFTPTTEIDFLSVWASSNPREGSYGMYNNTMTFKDIVVDKSAAIHQYRGLPSPAECLRNKYEKMLGREFWMPSAVVLNVMGETTAV